MIRKKFKGQGLQPIKITKTEACSQTLMLQLLSKLVNEQRQSNRLLKKLTGEPDNQESIMTINSTSSPRGLRFRNFRPILQDSRFEKFEQSDRQSSHSPSSPQKINYKISQDNSFNNASIIEQPFNQSNENSSLIVKGLENLKEVMERIEVSLDQNLKNNHKKQRKSIEEGPKLKSKLRIPNDEPKEEKVRVQTQPLEIIQTKVTEATQVKSNKQNIQTIKESQLPKGEAKKILESKVSFVNKNNLSVSKGSKAKEQKNKRVLQKQQKQQHETANLLQQEIQKSLTQKDSKFFLKADRDQQQKYNYALVRDVLPLIDKRQIKLKITLEDIMKLHKITRFVRYEEVDCITDYWVGALFRATASTCWNLLNTGQMSFQETKILFTENIIYNYIQFMKAIKANQKANADFKQNKNVQKLNENEKVFDIKRYKITELINKKAIDALTFLCTQYPQTKVQDPNIAIRQVIPCIDNKGQVEFDLIAQASRAKQVSFSYKKDNKNYTQQIMKTINYMINKTNEEFDYFKKTFAELFEEIFVPVSHRKKLSTLKQIGGLMTETMLAKEQVQAQEYAEQVKTYSKYLIGRKIDKNTPKYTEFQIQNGIFFIKSASILRIITKWVEELDQMVSNPDANIKSTQNQFKDHDGTLIYLYAQIKNGLCKQIKDKKDYFHKKVMEIKRQCEQMEVLLTIESFTTDNSLSFLSKESISVGKYCYYLKSAISSFIFSELNEVIHFLLSIPTEIDETKIGIPQTFYQEQSKKDLMKLNLIHFRIFDLLRCKCISKESQILYLITRLKEKNNDPNDSFKIMRVKDRLNQGTRDVLINAWISKKNGTGIICEIQLAVITNIDKKQELLDQFNHFLYELKRSKLGPISQNASIWSNLQQRASYFQKLIQKQEKECKHGEKQHKCIKSISSENQNISTTLRPIVCRSCGRFYEIPRTCLLNVSCKKCKFKYCGECHLIQMGQRKKKQYLFGKPFESLFDWMKQYTDYNEPLPMFGFVIRKYYLRKQILFFKVIIKSSNSQNQEDNKDKPQDKIVQIQIVSSCIENQQISSKPINKCVLKAKPIDGTLIIEDFASQQQLNNFIIYSLDTTSKNLRKETQPFIDILERFKNQKSIKYINLIKQPAYIQEIKPLKQSNKLLKKQINELKLKLKDERTNITYLILDNRLVIIAQIQIQNNVIEGQLIKVINIRRLKNFALEKTFTVSMDCKQLTIEMDLIEKTFQPQALTNFHQKTLKLYLNFCQIQNIRFVKNMKKLKQLYFTDNNVSSLEGIQQLQFLKDLIFDNNYVVSLLPLKKLFNLVQISASQNRIQSLEGIQDLKNLNNLCVYKNQVQNIEHLKNINLKELSLNQNKVEDIKDILHMSQTLQQFCIGGRTLLNIQDISRFTKLRKLFLQKLNLTSFNSLLVSNLNSLVKLSLADNQIEVIQRFEQETNELTEISYKNNRIRQITGLDGCSKLTILKLQLNFITDIKGIKNNQNLQVLNLEQNPLEKCSGLFDIDWKIKKIKFTQAKNAQTVAEDRRPKQSFYVEYDNYTTNRETSSGGNDRELEDQEGQNEG